MRKPYGITDKSLDSTTGIESLTIETDLYLPNGTVALPALAFANDTDCGLYRIGTNNLGLAVNATKILDIATTGLSITGNLAATGTIGGLTSTELTQLANINANAISSTQWAFISAMDQSMAAAASPTFAALTIDQIALDASTITFTGATGTNILSIPDNLADALSIKEGSNPYITCTTTNAAESITLSRATTVSAALTANSLTVDQLALDASTITFTGATGTNILSIPDNKASALLIAEGANSYMDFSSANGTEKILIAKQTEISSALIANSLTADYIGINDSTIAFNSLTTGTNTIAIGDNMADAFSVAQSTNNYITCKTTNSSEAVVFGVPVESAVQPVLIIEAKDDQALTTGTSTLILFTTPTTVFSQGSGITFSAGSFTIANAGIYLVCFSGTWAPDVDGSRFVWVNKSSSTGNVARYAENQMAGASAAFNIRQTFSAVMNVSAGQTINFWAVQSSLNDLALLGQSSGAQQGSTQASVMRLY
jgi:hypothetical protein